MHIQLVLAYNSIEVYVYVWCVCVCVCGFLYVWICDLVMWLMRQFANCWQYWQA